MQGFKSKNSKAATSVRGALGSSSSGKPCNSAVIHEISSKDLPYLITCPGTYRFCGNLVFSPKASGKTAITVDADNVHIDMNKRSLTQGNQTLRTIGISVLTGHENITITNGAIKNFTELGLMVEGGVSRLKLGDVHRVNITGCGGFSTFSHFDDVTNTPVLQGGILLGHSKSQGNAGFYTNKGPLTDISLSNVHADENSPAGMYLGIVTNFKASDCSFSRNYNNRQVGVNDPNADGIITSEWCIAYGLIHVTSEAFDDIRSKNLEFLRCKFNETRNSGENLPQLTAGFAPIHCIDGLTVRKCTFNETKGVTAQEDAGFGTTGVLQAGCSNVIYEDSEFDGTYDENDRAEGMHISGTDIPNGTIESAEGVIIRRCTFRNNTCVAPVYPRAIGLDLIFARNYLVEDCVATNNFAVATDPDNAFGYADGINLVSTPPTGGPLIGGNMYNGRVRRCTISGNNVNFTGGDVEGMYIQGPHPNLIVEDCVIQGNRGPGGDFNSGIWLAGDNADFLLEGIIVKGNTISDQNIGILTTDTKSYYTKNIINRVDFGFLLDGSTCDSVTKNVVNHADVAYTDTTDPSSSLFANNESFTVNTAFSVAYPFGPISTAPGAGLVSEDLSVGFTGASNSSDNVDVANPMCGRGNVRSNAKARRNPYPQPRGKNSKKVM